MEPSMFSRTPKPNVHTPILKELTTISSVEFHMLSNHQVCIDCTLIGKCLLGSLVCVYKATIQAVAAIELSFILAEPRSLLYTTYILYACTVEERGNGS